jgi:hypothetical protein
LFLPTWASSTVSHANMSKRFFYVYEDPDYIDELEADEELAELAEMDQFHQQSNKEHENA